MGHRVGYIAGGSEIENPEAYSNAIKRNIIANARKTWLKTQERADEIHTWLLSNAMSNEFARSLDEALSAYGKLSPNQGAAVLKIIDGNIAKKAEWAAKNAAENANAEAIVNGKQVITGEVITVKTQEGYYGDTLKMLVRDDRGFKVWGSVPRSLSNAAYEDRTTVKGSRVTFSATVEASEDDNKFGFYKRPTKAKLEVKGD